MKKLYEVELNSKGWFAEFLNSRRSIRAEDGEVDSMQ